MPDNRKPIDNLFKAFLLYNNYDPAKECFEKVVEPELAKIQDRNTRLDLRFDFIEHLRDLSLAESG